MCDSPNRARFRSPRLPLPNNESAPLLIGLLTPPVGLCAFVVNGVRPDIPLGDIFRGIWPFVLADMATVALLTAFPEIVTFILDLKPR